jgi:NAD+ kinase
MKVGILARTDHGQAGPMAAALQRGLAPHGIEVLLEKQLAALLGVPAEGCDERHLAAASDLLVVLGGDGTILRFLHRVPGRLPPVLGINLGSLGFLTGVSSDESVEAVRCIAAGNYQISHRTMLRVELSRGGKSEVFTGLNDAVLSRGPRSQLIKVQVRINGEELCVYNADGLIIATPTGSTAYSMSAGGPLLLPDSACFVLTPICPHVLTNRSTVMADTAELELRLVGGVAGVNVDGQDIREFGPGDVLRVSRAEEKLRLVTLPGRTFSEVLREKLKWSGSNV